MNDFDRFLLEYGLASDDTSGQIETSPRQEANVSEASHGQGVEVTVDAQQQGDSDESQPMAHEAVRQNGLSIPSPPFLRDVNALQEQHVVPQRSHSGNHAGMELSPKKLPAIRQVPLRHAHEPEAQSSSAAPASAEPASQVGFETLLFAYTNGCGTLLLRVLIDRSMYRAPGTEENPRPKPAKPAATNPDVVYKGAVVNGTLYARPMYRRLRGYDPIAMHLDGKLNWESMDRMSPSEPWRMIGASRVPEVKKEVGN